MLRGVYLRLFIIGWKKGREQSRTGAACFVHLVCLLYQAFGGKNDKKPPSKVVAKRVPRSALRVTHSASGLFIAKSGGDKGLACRLSALIHIWLNTFLPEAHQHFPHLFLYDTYRSLIVSITPITARYVVQITQSIVSRPALGVLLARILNSNAVGGFSTIMPHQTTSTGTSPSSSLQIISR